MTNVFDRDKAAKLLDLMAHPARFTVLDLISKKERDVTTLAKTVGLSQSALSQHLTKLRAAKLVDIRKDGHSVYYSCTSADVNNVLATLRKLCADDPGLLVRPNTRTNVRDR